MCSAAASAAAAPIIPRRDDGFRAALYTVSDLPDTALNPSYAWTVRSPNVPYGSIVSVNLPYRRSHPTEVGVYR